MAAAPLPLHTITYDGIAYAIEAPIPGRTRSARLLADSAVVDEATAQYLTTAALVHDTHRFEVAWTAMNRVRSCVLVVGPAPEVDEPPDAPAALRVPMDPPPGTPAARRARLRREHPALYASRHIAVAVGHVLFLVLGVGALIALVLPRIDLGFLPSIPLPRVDVPAVPLPSIPWPEVTLPQWLVDAWRTFAGSTKYWLPIVIAVSVARREIARNRAQEQARADVRTPGAVAAPEAEPAASEEEDGGTHGRSRPA